MTSVANDIFMTTLARLHNEYQTLLQTSNLINYRKDGKKYIHVVQERGPIDAFLFWFEADPGEREQCIRLWDIPGAYSGEILRLRRDLPSRMGDYEIRGDEILNMDERLDLPVEEIEEDDDEDVSDLLATSPLIEVDVKKHYIKKPTYRSEIANLCRIQDAGCVHVVQLLGRSEDGLLVFPKLLTIWQVITEVRSIAIYKRFILGVIEGLGVLHRAGIVHRDLHMGNILYMPDTLEPVICDLESHWGQRGPEIKPDGGLYDSGWTEKSDIYELGNCIKCWMYGNNPRLPTVDWTVPPPFDEVAKACLQTDPEMRPSLDELRQVVTNINDGDSE